MAWSALAPGILTYLVTESGVDRLRRVDLRTGAGSDASLPLPTPRSHFAVTFAELGGGSFAYSYTGSSRGLAVERPVFAAPAG